MSPSINSPPQASVKAPWHLRSAALAGGPPYGLSEPTGCVRSTRIARPDTHQGRGVLLVPAGQQTVSSRPAWPFTHHLNRLRQHYPCSSGHSWRTRFDQPPCATLRSCPLPPHFPTHRVNSGLTEASETVSGAAPTISSMISVVLSPQPAELRQLCSGMVNSVSGSEAGKPELTESRNPGFWQFRLANTTFAFAATRCGASLRHRLALVQAGPDHVSTENGVRVSFQTRVESDKRAADIQYITVRPTY